MLPYRFIVQPFKGSSMKRLLLFLALVLSFVSSATAQHQALISSFSIEKNELNVRMNEQFKTAYFKKDFVAVYDKDINLEQLDPAIVLMPFILNVVGIVWLSGRKFSIPVMDRTLYEGLQKVKKLYKRMYKLTTFDGELCPEKLVDADANCVRDSSMPAVCFTCGLDSTFTSLQRKDTKQLLITFFHHKRKRKRDQLLREEIKNYADHYGHERSTVVSNYELMLNKKVLNALSPEITNIRTDIIEGMSWIGLTAPIMASKGVSQLLISASLAWDAPYFHAGCPMVDETLGYAGVRIKHCGFESARADKHEYIAQLCDKGERFPTLRVCSYAQGVLNCNTCEKCLRTINGCWSAGHDHKKYGFTLSYDDAAQATRKLLALGGMRCYCRWHFMRIQKKWQERIGKCVNGQLTEHAKWFTSFDFDSFDEWDVGLKQPIDWSDVAHTFMSL